LGTATRGIALAERLRNAAGTRLPQDAWEQTIHDAPRRPDVVSALLSWGVSPNLKDQGGKPPLYWASGSLQIETARRLIAAGGGRQLA